MTLKQKFSDEDLQRIKSAVREAESKISGEIVPVIVDRSGKYALANYRSGIMLAVVAFMLVIVFDRYLPSLAVYDPLSILIIILLAGGIGAALPNLLALLKRVLVTQTQMDHETRQRAETVFLEEEVFNTRHRTGIMIFVSLLEHEVIVMADRGISKVVDQKLWDKVVNDLVSNIRRGKMVDGLVSAIGQCGNILLEKGFHKTSDDVNELRDDLRLN